MHLGHINLVWRVWELFGRPEHGVRLDDRFDGWERFAREIIMKKLRGSATAVKNGEKSAEHLAASDIWHGLNTYECTPIKFVRWLDNLDKNANRT